MDYGNGWKLEDSILYRLGTVSEKKGEMLLVNALDLDGTIIKSPSPNIQSPWTWTYSNTVDRIRQVNDAGWHTVIFSNRGDAKTDKMRRLVIQKIDKVLQGLGMNVDVFVATAKDENRKPQAGMFNLFLKLRGKGFSKYTGYMTGDAEGDDSPVPEYRRANDDKGFAQAAKLVYLRPVTYFTGKEL